MRRQALGVAMLGILGVVALAMSIAGIADSTVADFTGSQQATPAAKPIEVTVSEGTSMSVAVSPDSRTLAIDMQGSIWTLPAGGGAAKRLTDLFSDARQPTWSPDGKWISFFAYTDGGYDVWSIATDGSNLQQLTNGPFDDREPMWSHDGTRVAFSSDRGNPLGSDYNIWVLDTRSGQLRQITKNPAEDSMPSWSPDDKEIAFASTRENGQHVWAVNVADGTERKVTTSQARVDAPSWGPGGQIVYSTAPAGSSVLAVNGNSLTQDENAFPFRASWASSNEFYYVSDGKIRKRVVSGGSAQNIPFTATMQVTRAQYTQRKRDFDSIAPRQALGIVRPVISPDGTKVAFAALGDIHVMPIGGKPENVTRDQALDTDPAWSPDGSQLAYSSDKGGNQLQLWIRDMRTGVNRQVTRMDTQPQGAAWSPDGKRIAFFNVTGMWRVAEISTLDVSTGAITKIHDTLPQPGTPTWSPDGNRLAIAGVAPYSTRFREGTNQVLTISATASGEDRWYAPVPTLSIDSRGGCGPVWSPDGTQMAAIYEGVLAVWPVTPAGEPLGPPRRLTTESANSPSWQGDSRHILYLNDDKLKILDLETGAARVVPLDLKYAFDVPKGRVIVHAGRLVDMKSPSPRTNVDIVIEGNRIRSVGPHSAASHSAGQLVDASNLTAMPGLVEFHSHLEPDFGEAQGRAWLAFGVTTVRSPGGIPYEAVEERESSDANVRTGPRVYSTGHLMEYRRVYYKMGIALSSPAQLEMELQRGKILQYDLFKSYVRLPDAQQRRTVEFAHSIGMPVATHEIYPAAFVGVDNTEHTAATSRRGYSPKQGSLQRAYDDVIQLFGKSARIFCPMISGTGATKLFADEPTLKDDPRFKLYPAWMQRQVAQRGVPAGRGGAPAAGPGASGRMVTDAMRAGALIVAGTDTPNAINLHGEITAYVQAGMTPFEALKAATVNPAQALALDAGIIDVGKLADIIMVEGNPLENVANTHKVKHVIANGRVYELDDLLKGLPDRPASTR